MTLFNPSSLVAYINGQETPLLGNRASVYYLTAFCHKNVNQFEKTHSHFILCKFVALRPKSRRGLRGLSTQLF